MCGLQIRTIHPVWIMQSSGVLGARATPTPWAAHMIPGRLPMPLVAGRGATLGRWLLILLGVVAAYVIIGAGVAHAGSGHPQSRGHAEHKLPGTIAANAAERKARFGQARARLAEAAAGAGNSRTATENAVIAEAFARQTRQLVAQVRHIVHNDGSRPVLQRALRAQRRADDAAASASAAAHRGHNLARKATAHRVHGTARPDGAQVHTRGVVLQERTAPSTGAEVARRLANDTHLTLTCKTTKNGRTWLKLARGGYVAASHITGEPKLGRCPHSGHATKHAAHPGKPSKPSKPSKASGASGGVAITATGLRGSNLFRNRPRGKCDLQLRNIRGLKKFLSTRSVGSGLQHRAVQWEFTRRRYPGSLCDVTIPAAGPSGIWPGYADLIDLRSHELYEVKPESWSKGFRQKLGKVQRDRYINYFNKVNRFHNWLKPGRKLNYHFPLLGGRMTVESHGDKGMLYYKFHKKKPKSSPKRVPVEAPESRVGARTDRGAGARTDRGAADGAAAATWPATGATAGAFTATRAGTGTSGTDTSHMGTHLRRLARSRMGGQHRQWRRQGRHCRCRGCCRGGRGHA